MTRIHLNEEEARLRKLLLEVADYASAKNGSEVPQLRFAGGWVRDKLLGIDSPDIDIAVDTMTGLGFAHLMKDYIRNLSESHGYKSEILSRISEIPARPEQSKHLETATLKVSGLAIDLVNLRKETYSEESRNPCMQFGTPTEDALRRDSTINALFYNLGSQQVEDFTGRGLQDLQAKIIRTPLSPHQTFKDDPLRVLRCIRFASRLGYAIDPAAQSSMSDASIQKALRLKISRERVGIEVEKMLKGPHPEIALVYIDRLGLYNTIFTDPTRQGMATPNTTKWGSLYRSLPHILREEKASASINLRSILAGEDFDVYMAWLLCTLAPWASPITSYQYIPKKSQPKTAAGLVAREGLKIDNKSRDIIDKSMSRVSDVIHLKNSMIETEGEVGLGKRKRKLVTREDLGMQLHDWDGSWRHSVLLALLVEVMQADSADNAKPILDDYRRFLSAIQQMGLLKAHEMRPIVDGKRLMEEVGRKPGPWVSEAMRALLRWQFRNPLETNPNQGIDEVVSQFRQYER